MCGMLNYVPCQNMFKFLVSVNVILFENRIFIDAINLRCGHNGLGFPGGSDGKESAHNAGDLGLISGSGRFPGEGNGNPLQYSCLENSVDRGAWRATVHGVTKSQTRLSNLHTHTNTHTHTQWIRVGPKPVTTVLIKRGKFRHSHRREPQVLTEGEIGMMCLQAKECQGMPVITRS